MSADNPRRVTPLRRSSDSRDENGLHRLRDSSVTYADGAEERVLEILRSARDVSSTGTELLSRATNWAERYHFTPQRGAVLEFLDIPAGSTVLEIGAGCGAITRHLGDRGAVVDAIEPIPVRAAANRERCRDLPDVEVFVGELADVPDEPAYDFAVVIGVLEYVGGGRPDHGPYLEFLDGLLRRLRPGGQLLLAIENQLGVKYLAGAAEDHTNKIFDGIEGYPHQRFAGQPHHGQARTFHRSLLTGLIGAAGFTVDTVLACFPDYKLTRAVLDPSLNEFDPTLAHRIPNFPSPDWVQPRPALMSEGAVWRTLVDAGLAFEFPNSFLVCASKGGTGRPAWPDGQLAGFATFERQPGLASRTVLTRDAAGGAEFDRSYLRAGDTGPGTAGSSAASLQVGDAGRYPVVPGRDLIEVLAESDDVTVGALLRAWVDLLRAEAACLDLTPVDAVPHNVIRNAEGGLTFIDSEFFSADWTVDDVIARGMVWTGYRLGLLTSAHRWPGCRTGRDLIEKLWQLTFGEPAPGLGRVLDLETRLQEQVVVGPSGAQRRAQLDSLLDLPLEGRGPGQSVGPFLTAATTNAAAAEQARAEVQALTAELMAARAASGNPMDPRQVDDIVTVLRRESDELAVLKSSRAFRALTGYRRVRAKVTGKLPAVLRRTRD